MIIKFTIVIILQIFSQNYSLKFIYQLNLSQFHHSRISFIFIASTKTLLSPLKENIERSSCLSY